LKELTSHLVSAPQLVVQAEPEPELKSA
jgi:hypothetical protein